MPSNTVRSLRRALEVARKTGVFRELISAAKLNVAIVRADVKLTSEISHCLTAVEEAFVTAAETRSLEQAELAINALDRALENAEQSERARILGIPPP